jgi:hypothetical protein
LRRAVDALDLGSDTILGISNLYSIGAKVHIYIHVQVCKYAGNPLTCGETTIYKYTSNTSNRMSCIISTVHAWAHGLTDCQHFNSWRLAGQRISSADLL